MDVARHRVFADGRDVTLTHMEFELLRYLLINRGIALTRERLLDACGAWIIPETPAL